MLNSRESLTALIPQLVKSGSLARVKQIGIEMDTGRNAIDVEEKAKVLLRVMKSLHDLMKMGYRIVECEPNACVGRTEDQGPGVQRFNTKTNIVLYKMSN